MKFWKVAAILAIAAIPILIMSKKKVDQEKGVQPESGDLNDIFDRELTAE